MGGGHPRVARAAEIFLMLGVKMHVRVFFFNWSLGENNTGVFLCRKSIDIYVMRITHTCIHEHQKWFSRFSIENP